jgi:nitrogen fixation protein FixH
MKWNFGTGIAVVYSIFALSMLTAAIRSTHYDVGLVKKDYYADDLAYQQHFDKVQSEKTSGERLKTSWDTEGSLILQFPKTQTPPKGTITFFRPSKMGIDQTFDLKTNADNSMIIPTKAMLRGAWKIQIDWTANGTAFYREENIKL